MCKKTVFSRPQKSTQKLLIRKNVKNIFKKKQLRSMASIFDKFSVGLTNLLTKCTTTTL